MQDLVLGLDVGGTASRALVTTLDGTPVGSGVAGAGNPVGVPVEVACAEVSTALAAALRGLDPARIVAGVLGIAGTSRFGDPAVAGAFDAVWRAAGLSCPVRPIGDVVVAYAAGTDEVTGTVLISGTGAIAARISGETMLSSADGMGWLLGDLGSGFWLGRTAATAVARELHAGRDGALVRALLSVLPGGSADAFVTAVHERPPRDLAKLAPLVLGAVADDPIAARIADEAADHLVATAAEVWHPGDPVVLAGSVLTGGPVLRDRVRERLADRRPGVVVPIAEAGTVGAARLAARGVLAD
ncbi:N-acetylglucosamine kinase-like BadF-type ATPase [Allocatelliglobosispora scoriae]|uniref:N-acetylglucosamine kinase-like BadF-type ATPase n=1 Tax=Allocatelliglobosispora scoriae TaxID=643052 RepID=A0A841BP92_9ACTN|nr:BadF/BadG/BcrA/BcrD ATPase family protein [Allocatelliglobosispora scoriae]MBB5869126.1 N-acetylglucosamine kinase-like BadF-type ATPase [Allocatelliglobosispora scoriae]